MIPNQRQVQHGPWSLSMESKACFSCQSYVNIVMEMKHTATQPALSLLLLPLLKGPPPKIWEIQTKPQPIRVKQAKCKAFVTFKLHREETFGPPIRYLRIEPNRSNVQGPIKARNSLLHGQLNEFCERKS